MTSSLDDDRGPPMEEVHEKACGCPGCVDANSRISRPTLRTSQSLSPPSSSCPPPSDRQSSLRSFTGSFAAKKRGPAPSSFIDSESEASSSPTTLSSSDCKEEQTLTSSNTLRPLSRITSFTPNRSSIVSNNSRPSTSRNRRHSTYSAASKREYDPQKALWSQQSVLKRISWGWNQTFAGLTPDELTSSARYQARGVEYTPIRPGTARQQDCRPSTGKSHRATKSADTTPSVNKPFAHRRIASLPKPEVELPTVAEEESQTPKDASEETDDMHFGRFAKRFQPEFSRNKSRPVISVPHLISTTNSQISESAEIHPALRGSSYSGSSGSSPGTPISETPPLTDSSSLDSRSRSSSGNLSTTGTSPTSPRFDVAPDLSTGVLGNNHLTHYFAIPEKSAARYELPNGYDSVDFATPAIPLRAPSHSKRAHERVARTRSVRSTSSGDFRSSSSPPSSRHASMNAAGEVDTKDFASQHLGQLEEVEEDRYVATGYGRATASVYLDDLADMEALRFAE